MLDLAAVIPSARFQELTVTLPSTSMLRQFFGFPGPGSPRRLSPQIDLFRGGVGHIYVIC